jgi:hypothetical protein
VNGKTGWLGGGSILKTTDGGTTWELPNEGYPKYCTSLFFADSLTGWKVETFNVSKTTDGGKTWQYQDIGSYNVLRSIYFTDAQNGWVVGERGTIIHTSNGGGEPQKPFVYPPGYKPVSVIVFPNPAEEYVEVWSESTIYSISITDALGRSISPGPESWWSGQEANLDISSLRSGLYYLKIQSPSALKIERIVKK